MKIPDEVFYPELERRLANLKPDTRLFRTLRRMLLPLGYWRGKPRGVPFKKGIDERRNPETQPKQ